MDFIYGNLDKRNMNVVSGVFIDLTKAFDTVNHSILLRKMYLAGVRGTTHDLFKSYLSDRTQSVSLAGVHSSVKNVDTGVPQGSVLGPTLFLLFVNDIQFLDLKGKMFLYADDAALFYPGESNIVTCSHMNQDLEILSTYFAGNLLTLNRTKTKYINFYNSPRSVVGNVRVEISGELVDNVDRIVYLGVTLDSQLTFKDHIAFLCNKVSMVTAVLYKVRQFLPIAALKLIYFSLIHSQINYLCSIWANTYNKYIKPIQVLQNRAIKLIYHLPRLTNTVDLYHLYAKTILPIRGIQEIQTLRFLRQVLNEEVLHQIEFQWRENLNSLRDTVLLSRPPVRTQTGSRQISFLGPSMFNRLPSYIRAQTNTNRFVKDVKNSLLTRDGLNTLFER